MQRLYNAKQDENSLLILTQDNRSNLREHQPRPRQYSEAEITLGLNRQFAVRAGL
jgi:hypothetical protein